MKACRLLTVLALASVAVSATAMPNFARREGLACSVCHTSVPRLTRFGYEYRNSGFRTPNLIGEAVKDPTFGDMNAARIQGQAIWTRVDNEVAGTVTARGRMEFVELTLYPLTGSYGRYWSSLGEFSTSPEDVFEIENAYLRGTFGKADSHFQVRAGVFHPWEGYGASDRPASLARSVFQTTPARNGGVSTFFTTWGFDQIGVEAGYTYGPFNVAATLFNGIFVEPGPPAAAFPFQGGNLSRPTSDPNYNAKDVQLFANLFIPFMKNDAAISALYYHGKLSVPTGLAAPEFYGDAFDRVALYGTLPIGIPGYPSVWLLAGYQYGRDDAVNNATGLRSGSFNSWGLFGEIFVPVTDAFGASARYDTFRPSTKDSDNTIQAVTLAANLRVFNGLQGVFEYQYRTAETGATTSTDQHQVRLRLIGFY